MKTELLAPAGSMESLYAALSAGADAVYVGGCRFGARAYAQNLDDAQILEGIDYCHLHNKRLYLTVNTLIKEAELPLLADWLAPFYERGLDAVLVQDLGALRMIRRTFPGLPLHASTQMNLHAPEGVRLLESFGVSRVVMARELSLSELRTVRSETSLEIECFVHGALCVCYSGQCLLSSLIGGRSGNRGRCAQPCRLPYAYDGGESACLLSPRDICTLSILPDILEAGVVSLKIEGRMRQSTYVSGVTSVYRKYVDLYREKGRAGYRVEEADLKKLLSLYDRGGFSDGYWHRYHGREMMTGQRRNHARSAPRAERSETQDKERMQEKIHGKLMIFRGKPAILTVSLSGHQIRAVGPVVQEAKSRPVTEEEVRRQMTRTGNSPFVFDRLDIRMGERCFLPLQSLNALRREALSRLQEELLSGFLRPRPVLGERTHPLCEAPARPLFALSLERSDMLHPLTELDGIDRIYLDSACFAALPDSKALARLLAPARRRGIACWYILPPIFREKTKRRYQTAGMKWLEVFDGLLVKNLEELQWLTDCGYGGPVGSDYSLYTWNSEAVDALTKLGVSFTVCPPELSFRELKERSCPQSELLVYGRLPVMTTVQCLSDETTGCTGRPGIHSLADRMGKVFPVRTACADCCNVIYNSVPLSLHGMADTVLSLHPCSVRLAFTTESAQEVRAVTERFLKEYIHGTLAQADGAFTRGHYKRGVE